MGGKELFEVVIRCMESESLEIISIVGRKFMAKYVQQDRGK
jgi:hypothetical protein